MARDHTISWRKAPKSVLLLPWRVSSRQVGATRAGGLAAEPAAGSRPAEGGREVALTRSVQRTGAKAGAISPESFVRSRDIWPKAIRHVALSGRVKTCARFKSFPDRVQGTQERNEQNESKINEESKHKSSRPARGPRPGSWQKLLAGAMSDRLLYHAVGSNSQEKCDQYLCCIPDR